MSAEDWFCCRRSRKSLRLEALTSWPCSRTPGLPSTRMPIVLLVRPRLSSLLSLGVGPGGLRLASASVGRGEAPGRRLLGPSSPGRPARGRETGGLQDGARVATGGKRAKEGRGSELSPLSCLPLCGNAPWKAEGTEFPARVGPSGSSTWVSRLGRDLGRPRGQSRRSSERRRAPQPRSPHSTDTQPSPAEELGSCCQGDRKAHSSPRGARGCSFTSR